MEKLLRRVYTSKNISLVLKSISFASAIISAISFVAVAIYTFLNKPLESTVALVLSAAIPFVLVSVLRKLINAPRPYELYTFYEIKPKGKSGESFPSRHVFSAFVIATLSVTVSVWLCAALAVIALALAVARVLLGMHFWRDVAAGAFVGVISGVLGIFILM